MSIRFYIYYNNCSKKAKPCFLRLRTRQVCRNTLSGIAHFRLGSAALIHENLTVLRFSVRLRFNIYYNNLSKKAKPRFCLFPSICRMAYGRGECPRFYNMCATIYRGQRGKPLGFPLKISTFCFVSSKQKVRTPITPRKLQPPSLPPRTRSRARPAPTARAVWRGRQTHRRARRLRTGRCRRSR